MNKLQGGVKGKLMREHDVEYNPGWVCFEQLLRIIEHVTMLLIYLAVIILCM